MAGAVDELIDRVLADPPAIHMMYEGDTTHLGVWSTERACYRLLVEASGQGARTIETGSGISTILFAAIGARHTCVMPSDEERSRIEAYCAERGIATNGLTFEVKPSEEALPRVEHDDQFDLAFIDGNHGYPTPALDMFYAGGLLRDGGLLVLDDIHLPAVAQVVDFLDADPRWISGARTAKWASYQRRGTGSLVQDWWQQPFWDPRPKPPLGRRVIGKLRSIAAARR